MKVPAIVRWRPSLSRRLTNTSFLPHLTSRVRFRSGSSSSSQEFLSTEQLDKLVIAARDLESVSHQRGSTKWARIFNTIPSQTNTVAQIMAADKVLGRTVLSVIKEQELILYREAREGPSITRFLEAIRRVRMKLDATAADRLTHTEYQIINIQLLYYRNMMRGLRVLSRIAKVAMGVGLVCCNVVVIAQMGGFGSFGRGP